MKRFYERVVSSLLTSGQIDPDMTVLVVCGGLLDRTVLMEAGLQRVTISNLGEPGEDYAPYSYAAQDAEELACRDGEYDVVIVHSGLHHCRSPHRALLEMYRVARVGILVVRPETASRCVARAGWVSPWITSCPPCPRTTGWQGV